MLAQEAEAVEERAQSRRLAAAERHDRRQEPEGGERDCEAGRSNDVGARDAADRDEPARERGGDDRAEAAVERIERERADDVLRRNEPRNQRPRRAGPERRERRGEEREGEAHPDAWMRKRRVDGEASDRNQRSRFSDDEEAATIECIRGCATDEAQRQNRNELDERDRTDGEGGLRQLVHLVRQRDVGDLAEHVRHALPEPEPAEVARRAQRRDIHEEPAQTAPDRCGLAERRLVGQ